MKKMICKPATMDATKEQRSEVSKSKAAAKQKKKPESCAEPETMDAPSGIGLLVALEPRIMFDGAALATGAEVLQDTTTQDQTEIPGIDGSTSTDSTTTENPDDVLWSSGLVLSAPSDRNEIVFIDTSVDDFQTLMEGIDPNAEVILLDSTRDGIEQIAEILGERTDIDAVHIISHGDSGELRLGTGVLDLASMQGEYADELATINQALTEEADFLIYGCNFGEGDSGNDAATLLAELTGADIAASDDLTGAGALGGDWDLEVQTGTIETDVIIDEQAQAEFSGVLDITTGLVGNWTFDADATDSSGNSNDGTLSGDAAIDTTDATDIVGQGKLSLDGTDDYVDLTAHTASFSGLSEGTISAWVNLSASGSRTIFDIGDGASFTNYLSFFVSNGQLSVTIVDGGSTVLDVVSSATINDGTWHHVAFNASSSGNQLFIDGQQLIGGALTYNTGSSGTTTFINDLNTVTNTTIGAYQDGGINGEFQGLLDDVRIYDRSLASGDIAELATEAPDAQNDSATTNMNTAVNIDVTANDTDLDSETITVLDVGNPTNGTVVNNEDGTVTYTPTASYTGADSFTYVAADLDDTTSYWRLDGDAIDAVGTNDGVITGTTTVEGNYGDALSFDESDDHVVVSDFAMTDSFSLSFQIKIDDNTGSLFQYIYSHGAIDTTNSLNIFLNEATHGTDPNMLRTVLRDTDDTLSNTSLEFDASSIIGDGNWHTYTLTVAAGEGSKVYLDGVVQNTDATRGGDAFDPATDMYLGARQDLAADRFFGGSLDSVQVFNRALSEAEINNSLAGGSSVGTVNVTVNDAPVNTVPSAQAVAEDTTLAISGISVNDSDGNLSTVQLSVTSGTVNVTLSGAATVSAGADGTNTLTLSGTQTDINATLASLTYQGTSNFTGADTLTVTSTDANSATDVDVVGITVGLFVDTTSDVSDGDTSSTAALLANKGADGKISLRESIEAANNTTGIDTISFNIADPLVGGAHTIDVLSALPDITDSIIIDGTSEPDYAGTPIVELNGTSAGAGVDGLRLEVGSDGSTIQGLVINRFTDDGIVLKSDGNTIIGNYIGTDVTGTLDYGNGFDGIEIYNAANNIVGGVTAAERNIISGNDYRGLYITGAGATGNVVHGNYIGTDVSGTLALGNLNHGISVSSGANANTIGGTATGAGNIISNNIDGIHLDGVSNTLIQGNYIGTDVTGTVDLGNSDEGIEFISATNTTIGGSVVGARNVIAGNANAGIRDQSSSGTTIQGNYIGVDATGTATLANAWGIQTWSSSSNGVIGGSGANEGNLIGGNSYVGILLYSASGYTVQGNAIGTDATGTLDLGNQGAGISISTSGGNHLIGGTGAGEGNVIAFNTADGISVTSGTTGSSILGNQIYSNTSLEIDLGGGTEDGFGVTANDAGDADTGANNLQNYPVLTAVNTTGSSVSIAGTLNSTASTTYRIEFYASAAADGSGHGEAERYLGFATVTTDGSGNATINVTESWAVASGESVTATTTVIDDAGQVGVDDALAYGATSEFAQNVVANSGPVNTVPGAQVVNEDTLLAISGISVADSDTNLATVQLSVTSGLVNVSLSGGATISAGANDTTTLTISGTQADINATLASLTYQGDLNFNGSDTLTILSTDAGALTDSDSVSITVSSVNDAPVLDNSGLMSLTTITEDDINNSGDLVSAIIASVSGDRITDVDSGAVEGIAITGLVSSNGTWEYDTGSGWTAVGSVSTSSSLLLRATDSLRFVPDGLNADTAFVTFSAWDQTSGTAGTKVDASVFGGTSPFSVVLETASISVSAVNDQAVADLNGADGAGTNFTTTFTEGLGAINVTDSDAAVSDVDNITYQSLGVNLGGFVDGSSEKITIAGYTFTFGVNEVVVRTVGSTDFEMDFDGYGFTIMRNISGMTPEADLQLLVRGITYENLSEDPTTGNRTVDIIPEDGSGLNGLTSTSTISVVAVNDLPTMTNLDGDTLAYTEGDGAVVIEQGADAIVADVDSSNFDTGTLTVSFQAGSDNAEDVLAIRHQGSGAGQIGINGSDVEYGGEKIGSFFGGSSGTPLTILLEDKATPTSVTALIQNITYENTDTDNPTTGSRIVRYVLTDGDGGTSANYDTTVTVSGVNNAPTDIVFDSESAAEQLVNTYGTSDQIDPAIAAFDDGGYIVVWVSNGQDGSGYGLYGQRYNTDGSTNGSEFLVTSETTDSETNPSVATFSDGGFVVAWQDQTSGVYAWTEARVFNADGTPATSEFQVSPGVDGDNEGYQPTVVTLSSTDFAVVWANEIGGTTYEIAGQIYDRTGSTVGAQFTVGSLLSGSGLFGAQTEVTKLNDGGFAVVWRTHDGTDLGTRMRVMNADGTARSSEILLNGDNIGDVTTLADGNLVVTYDSGSALKAAIYDANGVLDTAEFTVNTTLSAARYESSVTRSDEGFVVSWESSAGDGSGSAILAQRFDASGNTIDGEVIVNQTTAGNQRKSELIETSSGQVIAVWQSENVDGALTGIASRVVTTGTAAVSENVANGTRVADVLGVMDLDSGDTHTFSLVDDAGGRFQINGTTGEITVANGTLLDYETATSHNITVRATDSGGLTYDEVLAIQITDVNDAPVNTVPGAQVVAEDTALNITGLSVNDVDGNLSTVQLAVTQGTVAVTLSGAATISAGTNGTNTLTLSGTQADINATLASLSYQGTLNYSGADTLTMTSTDGNSATDVDTVGITVSSVNDAPVNTVPGAQVVAEDTALNITGLSVNDVDGNLSTVQLAVTQGTVTVTLSGAATISAGTNGTNTLTLSGTQADINATLASLIYQGTANYTGADTLTVLSTDSNSATDSDTVAITVGMFVDTTSDVSDGDTSSTAALLANKGVDGYISLREAIEATNNTTGLDTINFDIGLTDAGHVYYQNDGIADSLTTIATTTLDDGSIADFDPDYVGGAGAGFSWWQIQPTSLLPTITDAVIIDGSTQTGWQAGQPVLELDGSLAGTGVNFNGFSLNSGAGSTIQGLAINQFDWDGIQLNGSGGHTVVGNFIGTDITGTVDLGNRISGIEVSAGSNNNIIGGATLGERNIIAGNNQYDVVLGSGTGNTVQGNYLGVDVTGMKLLSSTYGLRIYGDNNQIGGTGVGEENVIAGIRLETSAQNNTFKGNFIGTNAAGTGSLGFSMGMVVYGSDNVIGGTSAGAGNVISGNSSRGIWLSGASATGNLVQGNYIGTDITGTVALGNGDGVQIYNGASNNTIGGTTAGARNIISGNTSDGIEISGATTTGNVVQGNYIGTDVTGTVDLGNSVAGIRLNGANNIIGGTTAAERNVIAGNSSGITISSVNATGNVIEGNYIGTDATGTAALGNTFGIWVTAGSGNVIGGTASGASNVIAGNTNHGIYLTGSETTGNFVQGNYIGTTSGSLALGNGSAGIYVSSGASSNTIGGTTTSSRNVISSNSGDGIYVTGSGTDGNVIQGNFIGTNVAGTAALGNGDRGIQVEDSASNTQIGGTASGAGNVISGNSNDGIILSNSSSATVVEGNFIGTDLTGTIDIGNGTWGVRVTNSSGNTIGGTATGAGNTLAYNAQAGIGLDNASGTGNSLLGNAIYSNSGIGIDLGTDGVTANDLGDVDAGANDLQNFPVMTSASTDGANVNLIGTFNSNASTTYRIEFFASTTADGTGYGEAERYLGFATVTTDGSGNASFNSTLAAAVGLGEFVTATATVDLGGGNYGSTSEFAANMSAGNPIPFIDLDANDSSGAGVTNFVTSFTEDGGPVTLADSDATLTDLDSTNLASLTVTITNLQDGAFELLAADITGTSITASYDSGTGILTLSGTDTVANYEQVLRTVTYDNTSDNPTTTTRVIQFVADDGTYSGNVATTTITVSSINDAPVNTVPATATVAEDTALAMTGGNLITVTDVDGNLASTQLTVGNGTLSVTLSGSASISAGASGTNTLTISGSEADINATLASLSYQGSANFNGTDTLTTISTDSAGTPLSDTDATTITVSSINDAPVASNDSYTTAEDTTLTTTLATGVLGNDNDVDFDTLTVNTTPVANVTNGTLVLNADGSFTYTPNSGWSGVDTFTYQITDGNGGVGQATVTLTVVSVNDPPVLTSVGGGATAAISLAENLTGVTTLTATDADGDPLIYSLVGGADAARFVIDATSGALSFVGAPDFENPADGGGNNVYDVQLQVSDGQGGTDTQTLAISVTDVMEGGAPSPSPPDPTPEPEPESTPEPTPEPEPDPGLPGDPSQNAGPVGQGNVFVEESGFAGRGLEEETHQSGQHDVVNVLDLPPLLRPGSWATTSDQIRAYYPDPLDLTKTELSADVLQQLNQFSDELGQTMEEQAEKRSWIMDSMKGAGFTLTTGFVAWMVRGGALVAGLMASLPSWRHIDPVPILSMNKEEKEVWAKRVKAAAELEAHQHQGIDQILRDADQEDVSLSSESLPKSS